MSYSVRHAIHTDVETFWRLVFDQEVARALISEFGNAGDFEVVEDRFDEEGNRHRRIEVWATVELPSFVKKLVGDGSYTEVGVWDRKQMRYTAECVPKVKNTDRLRTRYEIISHPRSDGHACEREIITENIVKIPGVRGMIENGLEKSQRESHDNSAAFLNEWIQTHL